MRDHPVVDFVASALILGFLLLLVTCSVDEDYHLFVHDDDPASFEVTVSNTNFGGISICRLDDEDSTVQPMRLQLRGLNEDGTVDVSYERKVRIFLRGDDGSTVATDPSMSPRFVAGEATVESVAVAGAIEPEVEYVVHVEDEDNSSSHGESDPPFSIDLQMLDHFEVQGLPNLIPPDTDTTLTLTVYAYDQNGGQFPDFDGVVDLNITGGWTITPGQLRFSEGNAAVSESVTINGSGDFELTATVAAEQPDDVTCLGGLEGGDGGGGGGGGGGSAEPDTMTCQVSASPTDILTSQDFNIQIQITKTATNGTTYSTFDGSASVDSTPGTITATDGISQDITGTSPSLSGTFQVPSTSGEIEIGATVSDDDSTLTAVCEPATINATTAIGVYDGERSYGDLLSELSGAISSLEFRSVSSVNDISNIELYTALIVNMAGTEWATGSELTATQAQAISDYYDTGRPVFIAHDKMSSDVLDQIGGIWGISGTHVLTQAPPSDPNNPVSEFVFQDADSQGIVGSATITEWFELTTIGFTPPSVSGAVVEGRDGASGFYPIMVATTTGTKAIIAGEAIRHPWKSEGQPETQWWDDNQDLIVNAINWLVSPR